MTATPSHPRTGPHTDRPVAASSAHCATLRRGTPALRIVHAEIRDMALMGGPFEGSRRSLGPIGEGTGNL